MTAETKKTKQRSAALLTNPRPNEGNMTPTLEIELYRRIRDEALEEAALVVEHGHHQWSLGARIRARKSGVFTPPTAPAVLRDLGVDNEPRYW
jgi:hypothetical protein